MDHDRYRDRPRLRNLGYHARMACPHCQREAPSTPAGFTWWGGLIGAKILNHVHCSLCGGGYNSKTGRSNTTSIAIYMVVVGGVVLLAMAMLFRH
jgi:hypothetical protein